MSPLGQVLAVVAALVVAGAAFLAGRGIARARHRKEVEAGRDEASRMLAGAREKVDRRLENAGAEAAKVLEAAQSKADELRRATELEVHETRVRSLDEKRRREDELERQLSVRRTAADRRSERLEEREGRLKADEADLRSRADELGGVERELEGRRDELDQELAQAQRLLEDVAGMSAEEARERIIAEAADQARAEAASQLRAIREEAQKTASREARRIVAMAIQRMAADATAQLTVSVVQLRSDEMKGRIIGREGRNIRAFEQATGIDVVIDDTPEAVVLSGYNPVRREIARLALSRLIEDGRIHPGRIEEVVAKAEEDIEAEMREAADEVLYELGIHSVHDEIVSALGRLKFRTSYGQNQLAHAREVALLAGNMAAEMGLDVQLARRAGLLHDVGKALTHEQELTHVEIGHRMCKRHGEPDVVLNAIRAHHDEEPHRYAEAWLVTAADAISGSRPGARREMFDGYVKRLEQLEEIATEHAGVERCFAIQAGRELRVMVEPGRVNDEQMARISQSVARRIEDELQYPGQIKVVVIRETRSVDFAR